MSSPAFGYVSRHCLKSDNAPGEPLPKLRFLALHGGDEIREVLRNGGIWMVVGKGAIALAKQSCRVNAQRGGLPEGRLAQAFMVVDTA